MKGVQVSIKLLYCDEYLYVIKRSYYLNDHKGRKGDKLKVKTTLSIYVNQWERPMPKSVRGPAKYSRYTNK